MSKYNLVCPSGAPFAPSLRLLFSVLSAALDGPLRGQLRMFPLALPAFKMLWIGER